MDDDRNRAKEETDEALTIEEELDETDPELTDGAAKSNEKIAKLRQKLNDCEERKRKLGEDLQRTKADFLNARTRLQNEQQTMGERQIDEFIRDLLPLCDSFAMAMRDTTAWEAVDENWRAGVEGIKQQLDRILLKYQVTTLGTEGEPFDPEKHEAVETCLVADQAAHDTVVTVHQTGYAREAESELRIIRPARVGVGNYQAD